MLLKHAGITLARLLVPCAFAATAIARVVPACEPVTNPSFHLLVRRAAPELHLDRAFLSGLPIPPLTQPQLASFNAAADQGFPRAHDWLREHHNSRAGRWYNERAELTPGSRSYRLAFTFAKKDDIMAAKHAKFAVSPHPPGPVPRGEPERASDWVETALYYRRKTRHVRTARHTGARQIGDAERILDDLEKIHARRTASHTVAVQKGLIAPALRDSAMAEAVGNRAGPEGEQHRRERRFWLGLKEHLDRVGEAYSRSADALEEQLVSRRTATLVGKDSPATSSRSTQTLIPRASRARGYQGKRTLEASQGGSTSASSAGQTPERLKAAGGFELGNGLVSAPAMGEHSGQIGQAHHQPSPPSPQGLQQSRQVFVDLNEPPPEPNSPSK